MKASAITPLYTVYIVSETKKYNVSAAISSVDRSEAKKELAQSVTLQIANVKVGGSQLSDLISACDRIFIYANDGTKRDEVFRGYVWGGGNQSALEEQGMTIKGYDHLIYMQESEASEFFASGMATEDIVGKVCQDWGVKLEYTYDSITHPKLALRGSLSDILTSDILDPVKKQTGKDYTIISEKDVMKVKRVGDNKTIYRILEKSNAISATSEFTMNGVVTKVVILGTADSDDREPVEAVESGNTKKYGTLQKIIRRDENTTLDDAKKEARYIIKTDGDPKWSYLLKAPDIPWIRKGDMMYVNAGDIKNKYLIVDDIDRVSDTTKNEMTLTLSMP